MTALLPDNWWELAFDSESEDEHEHASDSGSEVEHEQTSDAEQLAVQHMVFRAVTTALSNLLSSKIARHGKAFRRYATLLEMVFRLRLGVDCDHGATTRLVGQILTVASTVHNPAYMGPTHVFLGLSPVPSDNGMSPAKLRLLEMTRTLFVPMRTCAHWAGCGHCDRDHHTHDPAERKLHSMWNAMLTTIRKVSGGVRLSKGDVRLQTVTFADVCDMFDVPAHVPVDAAPESVDAATVPVDAATESVDAAPEPVDAAPEPVDAAPESVDAATVPVDAAPEPVKAAVPAFEPVKAAVPAFEPVKQAPVLPQYWCRLLAQAATPEMYTAIEASAAKWGSSYHVYRQVAGSYPQAFSNEYSVTLGPMEICYLRELALYTAA
jgi:hypothetical protein